MRRFKHALFILALFVIGFSACSEPPTISEEEDIIFIPKTYDSKTKSFNNSKESPYSCLISTLADEEKEYNYWNQAFWIKIPNSMIEDGEETVLEVFVFSDPNAGEKSGAFLNQEQVVRVAQCKIPNSEKVKEKLEKQFKRFTKGSWAEKGLITERKAKWTGNVPVDGMMYMSVDIIQIQTRIMIVGRLEKPVQNGLM